MSDYLGFRQLSRGVTKFTKSSFAPTTATAEMLQDAVNAQLHPSQRCETDPKKVQRNALVHMITHFCASLIMTMFVLWNAHIGHKLSAFACFSMFLMFLFFAVRSSLDYFNIRDGLVDPISGKPMRTEDNS